MAKSEVLRQRLEIFINKYYQNLLIKGGIYTVSIGAMYFFLLALAEYLGRFGSTTRLILLIGLVAGLFGIMGYYIIYPLSKLLKLGKRISYEKAARIIGKHFPEVDDKLLNAIQLESLSVSQSELIQASIDQKIEKLSPVPFVRAIDFGENRKYWPILVIPILVFVGVALSGEWKDFTESGRRIAEFNKEFVPEAPFDFQLLTEDRVIEEGKSVSIRMSIVGEKIPSEASLVIGSEQMRMTREEGEFRLKTYPVFELRNRAFMTWEQRPYLFKFPNYRPITGSEDYMYQNITLSALTSSTGKVDNICMMIYDVTDVAAHKKQLEALQVTHDENKELQAKQE